MVLAVDRYPPDALVLAAALGQTGAVHDLRGDRVPRAVTEVGVLRRAPEHQDTRSSAIPPALTSPKRVSPRPRLRACTTGAPTFPPAATTGPSSRRPTCWPSGPRGTLAGDTLQPYLTSTSGPSAPTGPGWTAPPPRGWPADTYLHHGFAAARRAGNGTFYDTGPFHEPASVSATPASASNRGETPSAPSRRVSPGAERCYPPGFRIASICVKSAWLLAAMRSVICVC